MFAISSCSPTLLTGSCGQECTTKLADSGKVILFNPAPSGRTKCRIEVDCCDKDWNESLAQSMDTCHMQEGVRDSSSPQWHGMVYEADFLSESLQERARRATLREQATARIREEEEQQCDRRRAEQEAKKQIHAQAGPQLARQKEQATARRAQDDMAWQATAMRQKLQTFLIEQGFKDVSGSKRTKGFFSSGFTYPLHAAVRTNDAKAVQALLWGGALPTMLDSQKLSPQALACQLNRKGSHAAVLAALQVK